MSDLRTALSTYANAFSNATEFFTINGFTWDGKEHDSKEFSLMLFVPINKYSYTAR